MSYLATKTPLQIDQAATEADILAVASVANALASAQAASFARFWHRPPERILAELNSDPGRYVGILGGNTAIGAAINATLHNLADPNLPYRAPTAMPEGWGFSPKTGFSYTPAREPEPAPE